jgi:hypothetical protein
MTRRASPDTPDWAAAALGEFMRTLHRLVWVAGIAVILVLMLALGIALQDLPGGRP